MIMVENEGHNPDPEYTSFSCRIPNTLRKLPESERPNLIALLKEYGEIVSVYRRIELSAASADNSVSAFRPAMASSSESAKISLAVTRKRQVASSANPTSSCSHPLAWRSASRTRMPH